MKFRRIWIFTLFVTLNFLAVHSSIAAAQQKVKTQKKSVVKKKTPPPTNKKSKATDAKSVADKIVENPDIDPMFGGGSYGMSNFIMQNMNYPQESIDRKAEGLVVWTFIVEKDGTMNNFEIIHRADSALDQEALRIIKLMPPWRPAKYNGEFVRAKTYVPMLFKLNNGKRVAARNPQPPVQSPIKIDSVIMGDEKIYSIVDQMPQFPGGEERLASFLTTNLEYPRQARQDGLQGRILCSFVVGKDGRISDIQVVEGVDVSLNDEAVRLLSVMPAWNPGINEGEKVRVRCVLPIDFKITEAKIPASSLE